MRYYTVKYWETRGIQETEASPPDGAYVYAEPYHRQFVIGRTAFTLRAEAVEVVRKLAARKIVSLKKKIAAVEKIAREIR